MNRASLKRQVILLRLCTGLFLLVLLGMIILL